MRPQKRSFKDTWIRKHLWMLIVFIGADLMMLFCYGLLFLSGMEFTGLQLFQADPSIGFEGNPHVLFHVGDYFTHCTLWCLIEDCLITLILAAADGKTGRKNGKTETVYFWILHVSVKMLLNLHATAMFLGVLTYSRESLWKAMSPLDPSFGMYLKLPEHPFSRVTWSLCLSLAVLLITCWILAFYASWERRPYLFTALFIADVAVFPFCSDSIEEPWQKALIVAVVVAVLILGALADHYTKTHPTKEDKGGISGPLILVFGAAVATFIWVYGGLKLWMRIVGTVLAILVMLFGIFRIIRKASLRRDVPKILRSAVTGKDGKLDLYVITELLNGAFILFTLAFGLVRIAIGGGQMNSLFGFQYSAIVKLLVPVVMVGNWMLRAIERRDPTRYVQHTTNGYLLDTLVMVGFACIILMVFSEFGSVVCILALTIAMMLLYVDRERFPSSWKDGKGWAAFGLRFLLSCILGFLLFFAIALTENTFFQVLLSSCTEEGEQKLMLPGRFLGMEMSSRGVIILGGVLAVVVLLPVGAVFLYRIVFAACRMLGVVLQVLKGKARDRGSYRLKEILCIAFNKLLNKRKKARGGKLTIGDASRFRDRLDRVEHVFTHSIMVWTVLLFVAGGMLCFNFAFGIYNGRTILQGYYMTAGRFSASYEITANVTEDRKKEAKAAYEAYKARLKNDETPKTETTEPAVIPDSAREEAVKKSEGKEVMEVQEIMAEERSWEDLKKYYAPLAYTGNDPEHLDRGDLRPEVMRLIDRLCFPSKTAELSAVQMGMRRNMGFQVEKDSTQSGYIPTLQTRSYVTLGQVDALDSLGQSLYYAEDGSLREGLYLLNARQGELEDGQTPYIWIDDTMKASYQATYEDSSIKVFDADKPTKTRIFCTAEPSTAVSDYVIYTLSRMGVCNVLLLMFIPYLTLIVIMLFVNGPVTYEGGGLVGGVHYMLRGLSTLYAISFAIQAMVIVTGVTGVSLFSGLSAPLVAAGNCEMMFNSMCAAIILIAAADFSYTRKE